MNYLKQVFNCKFCDDSKVVRRCLAKFLHLELLVFFLLLHCINLNAQCTDGLIDFTSTAWNSNTGWSNTCPLTNPQTILMPTGVTLTVSSEESGNASGNCGALINNYNSSQGALNSYADGISPSSVRNLVRFGSDNNTSSNDTDSDFMTCYTFSFDQAVDLDDFLVGAIDGEVWPDREFAIITFYDALVGGSTITATTIVEDPLGDGDNTDLTFSGGSYTVTPENPVNASANTDASFDVMGVMRIEVCFYKGPPNTPTAQSGSFAISGFTACPSVASCTTPSAPVVSVTDNVCPVTTGTFTVTTSCGSGSHIEYSTDNGSTWSTTQPSYTTSAFTFLSRCVDDNDATCFSSNDSDTTAPTTCSNPCPSPNCFDIEALQNE